MRTIKESCLERMVLIGKGSLRRAVREFVAHYHHERNHQGLDNRLILPLSTAPPPRGVGARMRAGLRASHRRARHLPMRYETGLPSSVIRFRT